MTKIGMCRQVRNPVIGKMVKVTLNSVSPKQAKRLMALTELKGLLIRLCGNKSEFSGEYADWQTGGLVEPHHILGRVGKNLLNPFSIIMVTRPEHDQVQKHNSYENRQFLLGVVKTLRLKQGFVENDYE